MTLLIALILNSMFEQATGEPWCSPLWIAALWLLHVIYHSGPSKK